MDKKPVFNRVSKAKPISKPIFDRPKPISKLTELDKIKWSFSFKYFHQIEYFGVNKVDSTWFVSLLTRFKDLSDILPEDFFTNRELKDGWRYHEINWESKNIPIKKQDLNWVDSDYLDNDDDFPFYQFHVSKAKGRVVGFWEKGHKVFNIVLLDPLHNIQPAGGKYQYKVNDCSPLSCQYTSLVKDIEDIKSNPCKIDSCHVHDNIKRLPKRQNETNAIVAYLDDDFLKELEKALQQKTISEILEAGIVALMA